MSADLCFTSGSFFLSSFFFCRRLTSELTERNSTKIGNMLASNCDFKTHVQKLGYSLPLQIGGQKTTSFGRLCNLTAILTAYIFGIKRDIDNRSSALTTRGLLYRPETSRTSVRKRLKTRPVFLPTLCKLQILLSTSLPGFGASQTEISKQNSTTLCQMADGRPR